MSNQKSGEPRSPDPALATDMAPDSINLQKWDRFVYIYKRANENITLYLHEYANITAV